jgi:glycosyltransferase involved in cell wall biosynthesis
LPAPVFTGLKSAYRSVRHRQRQKGRLKEIGADLLFCPFTAPFFYDPSVPTVSVIYDLQYLDYPEFFSSDERYFRDKCFTEACRLADRLVCISEYVRGTVLANSDLSSDRVAVIHPRLFNRLQRQEPQNTIEALKRRSLLEHNFLLYPANFWLHKNHRVLFTALGMYRARHPESELKLVCTGVPDKQMEDLRGAVQRMGLEEWIVLAGYLSDEEFAALLQSCLAVIFPSLYEGFGMPLLEAMAFGKPVLCSNVTSLPEVAGDAALYFDPRRPQEIVSAIERIATDPELVAHLVECGYRRLATFGSPEQMAQQYLHVFRELMTKPRSFTEALQGVYPDGWTGERVVVTYGANSGLRHLEMLLQVPPWLPHDHVSVTVFADGSGAPAVHAIARGQSAIVRQTLPNSSGYVECVIEPTFQPKTLGLNDDERILGCLCQACRIISAAATHDLLEGRG